MLAVPGITWVFRYVNVGRVGIGAQDRERPIYFSVVFCVENLVVVGFTLSWNGYNASLSRGREKGAYSHTWRYDRWMSPPEGSSIQQQKK